MKIRENRWKKIGKNQSLKIHENLWQSMKIYQRKSMEINENQ